MYQHILVPVDDSELAVSLASQAVAFAKSHGARLTFFHARPDFAATSDGAVMHALSPAQFEERAAGNARAIVARAEAEARLADVDFASRITTSDRPFEAILDAADECGCDLIFIASHGRRGVRGLLLGSQTHKVLAHTRLPVLVATVETNVANPSMEAAVAIIQGEHRSMAAVMHALKHSIGTARASGTDVEPALLRAVVQYFRRFSAGLHHPKEDVYLFARLRARAGDPDGVLATLERQHHEEEEVVAALESAIDAYARAPGGDSLAVLAQSADTFAARLWAHMSLEEKVVLPACREHLAAEDWVAVAGAFEANGDPRFDRERMAGMEKLFLRLVSHGA